MARYIARRLLLAIPVMLGATLLIFAMVFALPGDPIRALAGDRPLSPAVAAQIRDNYNLNDPLPVQYGKYVAGLVRGDLGTDFQGRPVTDTVKVVVDGFVGETLDRSDLVSVCSPVVLPASVVAGLDALPSLDFATLVATLRQRFPVEYVEAPAEARRVASEDDVTLLAALTSREGTG